jgi:hypothetical protein
MLPQISRYDKGIGSKFRGSNGVYPDNLGSFSDDWKATGSLRVRDDVVYCTRLHISSE